MPIAIPIPGVRWQVKEEEKSSPPTETSDEKARRLLERFLTTDQLARLTHFGYLDVPGKGQVYRIGYPKGPIDIFSGGCRVGRLCVIVKDPMPDADWFLTLVLMAQGAEDKFLKQGNFLTTAQNLAMIEPNKSYIEANLAR